VNAVAQSVGLGIAEVSANSADCCGGHSNVMHPIEHTDTLNVLGEGGECRFGKSEDITQSAKPNKFER
jgi:hypothetical protein